MMTATTTSTEETYRSSSTKRHYPLVSRHVLLVILVCIFTIMTIGTRPPIVHGETTVDDSVSFLPGYGPILGNVRLFVALFCHCCFAFL